MCNLEIKEKITYIKNERIIKNQVIRSLKKAFGLFIIAAQVRIIKIKTKFKCLKRELR